MKYKVFPVTFDTTGVTLFDCKNIVNGLKKKQPVPGNFDPM